MTPQLFDRALEDDLDARSKLLAAARAGQQITELRSRHASAMMDPFFLRAFAEYARQQPLHARRPFVSTCVIEAEPNTTAEHAKLIADLERAVTALQALRARYSTRVVARLHVGSVLATSLLVLCDVLEDLQIDELELVFGYTTPRPELRRELETFLATRRRIEISLVNLPFCFAPSAHFRVFYRALTRNTAGQIARAREVIASVCTGPAPQQPACRECRCRLACHAFSGVANHPEYEPFLAPKHEDTLIFAGASVKPETRERFADPELVFTHPAQQGDFMLAVLEGFAHVLLIDGYFSERFSCTTFEVLMALEAGLDVFGASSMGALRARELDGVGMRASGYVYDFLRARAVVPYHVVAQLYDDEDNAVTDPLISVCFLLDRAVDANVLSRVDAGALADVAEEIYYQRLTFEAFFRAAVGRAPAPVVARLRSFFDEQGRAAFDVKSLDAVRLLSTFRATLARDGETFVSSAVAAARTYALALVEAWKRTGPPLPKTWDRPIGGASTSRPQGRERPAEHTLALAESHFDQFPHTLSDTSRYIDCRFYMFNIIFVPFYFMERYLSTSSGFGGDRTHALAAAYMELFERIAGHVWRQRTASVVRRRAPDEWRRVAQFQTLPLQYQDEVNGTRDFVPVTELNHGRVVWVPRRLLSFLNSTGLSAGNTLLECICNGLLEAIERETLRIYEADALTLLRSELAVEPEIEDDCYRRVREHVASLGLPVAFFSLPNPFSVPVVECHVRYRNEIFAGMSSRLDEVGACERSFYEALNSLFAVIAGSRDDMSVLSIPLAAAEFEMRCTRRRRLRAWRTRHRSLHDTVRTLLSRLARAGYDRAWALDITPLGASSFASTRVVVPNFELQALTSAGYAHKVERTLAAAKRRLRIRGGS